MSTEDRKYIEKNNSIEYWKIFGLNFCLAFFFSLVFIVRHIIAHVYLWEFHWMPDMFIHVIMILIVVHFIAECVGVWKKKDVIVDNILIKSVLEKAKIIDKEEKKGGK